MRTTRPEATRRVTTLHSFIVSVIGPGGDVAKVVRCKNREDAMEVIEAEAADAPVWTMLLLSQVRRGRMRRVARWAVGPHGLARTPYRGKR